MTPGASAETADGMSEDKIRKITEAMRAERSGSRSRYRHRAQESHGFSVPHLSRSRARATRSLA